MSGSSQNMKQNIVYILLFYANTRLFKLWDIFMGDKLMTAWNMEANILFIVLYEGIKIGLAFLLLLIEIIIYKKLKENFTN